MIDSLMHNVPLVTGLLYALSFGGLAYFILQTLQAGAETYASEYTAEAGRQLEDMFVFIPPRRILELAFASSAAAFIALFSIAGGFDRLAFVRGLICGAFAAIAGWQIPSWSLLIMRRRRLLRFNQQLADSLLNMSNALRAGFSILQAFEAVVREKQNPISQEFGVFLHQVRVGMKIEDALENLQARVGSEDMAIVVSAIETARQTGGNLTEVFEKIAHTIRERSRIERRIRTLTAQGRLQGVIVGAMPLLLGLAIFAMEPGMMVPFLRSTAGVVVLLIVLVFELAGALIIRKIVNIDV